MKLLLFFIALVELAPHGLGQGIWPGPGQWLGHRQAGDLLIAAAAATECYQ